jgi:monoterpene epsilon-lactone hydrolase
MNYNRNKPFAALLLISSLTLAYSTAGPPDALSTISEEAQKTAETLVLDEENRAPKPDDFEGWEKYWSTTADGEEAAGLEILEKLGATAKKLNMAGVPVLDIKPKNWKDNGKVLIYTHGGAYTLFSASTTLSSCVPVADLTGLRIISVDYTVAPRAKWQATTSQVVSVIKALKKEGYGLKDIAIFGDSAGGGLAAGSVLKARDEGVGLVAAVVLWSPWSDITESGDTYSTLKKADPVLSYANVLKSCADAYADPKDQKHPYVSPIYGDYSKGFPPTLIQVGTKEIFLSNSVRHYQVLDQAGIPVKLDPYEGMWHVFQAFHWQLPESVTARKKMAKFLRKHLKN